MSTKPKKTTGKSKPSTLTADLEFVASRAALGIALGQVLLPADRANYAYAASMLDQTFPSCEPDMQKAFAEVGKILSEIDEKRLQELQLRALEIITNSVLTKDSLFD